MKSYKNYVFSAMLSALILIGTMFIQIPSINGYVHIGDALIYMCACILPFPFSVLASGLGAALADALTPFIIFAPFTFIIKACMAFFFTSKGEKILTLHNIIAVFVALIINVGGYYTAECILFPQNTLYVTLIKSLATIPGNLTQSIAAGMIFVLFAAVLDKMGFKRRIKKGE